MKVRIRQAIDRDGDIIWKVETKGGLIPWWREHSWFLYRDNAEKVAKVLVMAVIVEYE
jgi:hypothetical protein